MEVELRHSSIEVVDGCGCEKIGVGAWRGIINR